MDPLEPSIEAMLLRLRMEYPEYFSRDPTLNPAGLVTVRFNEPSVDIETESPNNPIREILSHVGVYTIVDDYILLDAPRETLVALRHELIREILSKVDQASLLLSLKTLATAADSPAKSESLAREFLTSLSASSRIRLDRLLQEGGRIFLYRQQILAAIREVILSGRAVDANQMDPLSAAIILSHAVLDAEDVLENDSNEQIGGLPPRLAIHLAANQDFNSKVDVIARFDRAIRLWREYGPRFASRLEGKDPHDVLKSRFGLDIEDILAVAFGVWSYDLRWDPVNPRPLAHTLHPRTSSELVTSFMDVMAADLDTFSQELLVRRSDWDFLPFEMRPIIELESGWLLIDAAFLMDRVTSGLYYFVFDDLKSVDESLALEWSRIWGDMVEDLVRDNVAPLARLSNGESRPIYDEDELALAYPGGGGRADIVVDFGETVIAFEVVSGHTKIETRLGLDQNAFNSDMEKIVYKKLRQLDGTATNVVNDPTAILGDGAQPLHFQPVVVAAGGFPFNFGTSQIIDNYISTNRLFLQKGAMSAAVIDLTDLEMIEALHEDGESVVDLIRDWKSSSDRHQPFRNWLINSRDTARARPQRMDEATRKLTSDFSRRLNLADDEISTVEDD